MTPEVAQFSNKGMNQDISVSKATNELAFENYNIRITAVNDNTLLSVTNEKLPTDIPVEINNKVILNKITWGTTITSDNKVLQGFKSEYSVDSDITINYTLTDKTTGEVENNTTIIKKGNNKSEDIVRIPFHANLTYSISLHSDDRMYYYTSDEEIPEVTKDHYIKGLYLGHAILNNYLVLFTKTLEGKYPDFIYVLTYDESVLKGDIKYQGDLNFQLDKPIETLPYYESELVQKVYWVDGVNQPRVINIASNNIVERLDTQFDFNPSISKFPEVDITKEYSGVGLFPAGVIQYFVSYYNKYGAETGIVWASDLQYVTEYNRAAGPDETVVCSFKIDISNVDTTYDYARVYSMQRTSLNTTPICRIVGDININNSDNVTIIDTNTNTETIDPTQLLFLGGDNFIASTLTQKDDVLFLGDLEIKSTPIPQEILKYFEDNRKINEDDGIYSSEYLSTVLSKGALNNKEEYLSNKHSSRVISGLKYGEVYRVGIQFQSKDSVWSSPIWVGDIKNYTRPIYGDVIALPKIQYVITSTLQELLKPHYINYRLLIVEPTYSDRSVLAQGIVSPTVFNIKDRITKRGPYGISSWIARPRNGKANFEHLSPLGNSINDGEYTNLETCEIQNSINEIPIIDEDNEESNFVLSISMYSSGGQIVYALYILNVKNTYISEGEPINNFAPENIKSVYWSDSYVASQYPEYMPQEEFDQIIKIFEEQLHLEGGINGLTLDDFKSVFSNAHFDDSYRIVGTSTWSTGDFRVKGGAWIKRTNEDAEKHSIYTIAKTSPLSESLVETKSNNYYVDSSLVSFHSPEIDNVRALIDNTDLKFRIIGIAPIKNTLNDVIVESKTTGNSADSGFIKPDNTSYFLNAPMYRDNIWNEDNVLEEYSLGDYYMYLWNKKGSIIGQTANSKKLNNDLKPVDIDRTIAELQHKIIALKTISDGCISLPRISQLKYDVTPSVFSSDIIESKYVKGFDSYSICQGNYDNVVVTQDKYKVFWNNSFSTNTDSEVPALQSDPVSIKYTKTPHVLFNLKHEESYEILPYLTLGEKPWNLYSLYNQKKENPTYYSWLEDGKIYKQRSIIERCNNPYFYIGELYRDIDYSTLYGGYNENDLEQCSWIPISNPTNIEYSTNDTWGDTYYQRWECLNTYPSTEEDLNSVVDIVSFMVETHINLEGRYDKNRNGLNILNARPDNFNKINPVYSQTNNYFTYNILDEKFNQNKYFNQVAFSLQKTPTSEIDTWCNISLASAFNLDGKHGKLNKLITVNDAVLAFQDKALSVINFNNRTAISTENGVPIEIANSGKVNGYSIISSNVGCQNKLSICEASSGVYFIDDLNKTMYGFNKEGLSNISSKGMSMWFKKNLTGKEKCFYDRLTNDVYITNDTNCLVYNESLNAFTSFMDYSNINSLFNFEGKSFIFDGNSTVNAKLMFAGDYTNNYYIQYKINPEPLTDKTFTNIEFIADKLNDDSIDSIASKKNLLYPFTEFEVWNEYQYGINNLTKGRTYPNFERKFRIWRADIPRDKSNGRDRIRNPWIYLKLNNTDNNNAKMAFHSFLVKYYK